MTAIEVTDYTTTAIEVTYLATTAIEVTDYTTTAIEVTYLATTAKNLSPPYICGTFELSFQKSNRSLRNNYRIYVPNVRTNLAKNGFYFQGATLWNSLHPSLYLHTSLNNFKSTYIQLYFS